MNFCGISEVKTPRCQENLIRVGICSRQRLRIQNANIGGSCKFSWILFQGASELNVVEKFRMNYNNKEKS